MDLHNKWPHRWRNKKTESRNSPIHGLGVFASQDITKGELVIVYGGIIIPATQIQEYWAKCGHIGIQISKDFFIVPAARKELIKEGVINHSCHPNIGFRSQIELIAIRDIKKDEELTLDYACCESLMESFACDCGATDCRGMISADDWELPYLQRNLGEYYAPYLKKKI